MTEQPYGQMPQYPQSSADWQSQQPAFQVPTAPDGRPLAGAGQRLGARLLDSLFWLLIMAVVAGGIVGGGLALAVSLNDGELPVPPWVPVLAIIVVVIGSQYVYEVEVPLRYRGRTPGKMILKIEIAPLQPGAPLTRGALANRFMVAFLFNLLSNCYIGLIDPLWLLWDKPYRQCLHDKPAKTVVVTTAP